MSDDPTHQHFDALEQRLRRAEALTPELMSHVIATACTRFPALGARPKVQVNGLIEAGAWIDAALALLQYELPQWKLRRLIEDDGEWLCSLSRQPGLPLEYDEVAEASHENCPLAILIALVQARRASTAAVVRVPIVPQRRATSAYAVCCDDFS